MSILNLFNILNVFKSLNNNFDQTVNFRLLKKNPNIVTLYSNLIRLSKIHMNMLSGSPRTTKAVLINVIVMLVDGPPLQSVKSMQSPQLSLISRVSSRLSQSAARTDTQKRIIAQTTGCIRKQGYSNGASNRKQSTDVLLQTLSSLHNGAKFFYLGPFYSLSHRLIGASCESY